MSRKRSTLLVSALAAAAAALSAQAAEAKTYCVAKPTYKCPAGSTYTNESLQKALSLAQQTAEADTIKIGPGTFKSPAAGWDAINDRPLTVSGSGSGTVLDATGQTDDSPAFDARSAALEKFKLLAPAAGTYRAGIETRSATLVDVTVVHAGKWGFGIVSRGSSLKKVTVEMSHPEASAVYALPDFLSTSVVNSDLTGRHHAILGNKADIYVTRSRLFEGGAAASGGTLYITDSVIRLGDEWGEGVSAQCAAGTPTTTVFAEHLTILGGQPTEAATAGCLNHGVASKLTVKNSILAAGISLRRTENAGRSDIIALGNLLIPGAKSTIDSGPLFAGKISKGVNHVGTPSFEPGTVALTAGSYVIDKALPSKSKLDLMGKPRPKDGDGDGVAAGDVGARERQTP